MRATVMYGAGDVRIEDVPDAHLIEPSRRGLTANQGWIGVDAGTPATPNDGVYAVGDVTSSPSRTACHFRRPG